MLRNNVVWVGKKAPHNLYIPYHSYSPLKNCMCYNKYWPNLWLHAFIDKCSWALIRSAVYFMPFSQHMRISTCHNERRALLAPWINQSPTVAIDTDSQHALTHSAWESRPQMRRTFPILGATLCYAVLRTSICASCQLLLTKLSSWPVENSLHMVEWSLKMNIWRYAWE